MKTLKINSFKMTIQMLLLTLLLTSACAQSDKKTTASI